MRLLDLLCRLWKRQFTILTAGAAAGRPAPGVARSACQAGRKPLEGERGLEIYQQGSTGSLKGVIFFCASRKPSYIRQVTSVRHIYIYY